MAKKIRCVVLFLLGAAAASATTSRGDPLVGDVAASYSTAEAAQFNPANAAFLGTHEFFYAPEIYKSETVSARYPGFDTSVQDGTGIVIPLVKPSMVFKLSQRWAIGGFYVPALPIKIDINKKQVPVILLTTQKKVDIAATGGLNGLGVGMLAFRMTDSFGIGIGADYMSVDFDADLTPSEGGTRLAKVGGTRAIINVLVGARFEVVPNQFSLGVAVTALTQQTNIIKVSSPLISGAASTGPSGGASDTGNTNYDATRYGTSVLLGANVAMFSRLRLLVDGRYTRVDPQQSAFSLVDLRQKTADVHDTFGVRLGTILRLFDGVSGLFGLRYEPASVGPGARGDGSATGFGTIQLVEVLAGLSPLTPYYLVAGGLQLSLWPSADGKTRSFNRLILEGGIAYTYSSLGIGAKGELPGAYLQRRLSVPVALGLRF